jgi:hypothetical protein
LGVGARERLQVWVVVLEKEPSARPERADHPFQRLPAPRKMDEHETLVDEIEGPWRGVVHRNIATKNLDVVGDRPLHPSHVDVGGDHATGWPDSLRQPLRDRRSSNADLPALPPLGDPQYLEVAERHRVEECGETVETLSRLRRTIVEEIAAVRGGRPWFAHDHSVFPTTARVRWL